MRRAQTARSYEGMEPPANPTAARTSRPHWSSTGYWITWSARPPAELLLPRRMRVSSSVTFGLNSKPRRRPLHRYFALSIIFSALRTRSAPISSSHFV
jgi:hypothetical protein